MDSQSVENTSNISIKYNKNTQLFLIVGVIIAILVIALIVYLLFSKNINNSILLYVNSDKDLKYVTEKMDKGITISRNHNETMILADYNESRNKILFSENRGLYLVNVGESEPVKISASVNDFKFINDDIFYLLDAGDLYLYNKEKTKIDVDVKFVAFVKDNNIAYIKDNYIYLYDIKKSTKEILLKNKDNISYVNVNNDYSKIILIAGEDNTLSIYDISSKSLDVIDNNVSNIINSNEDYSKIFYNKIDHESKLYQLLVDDTYLESDKKEEKKKYTCEYNDYDAPSFFMSNESEGIYYLYKEGSNYIYLGEDWKEHKAGKSILNNCKLTGKKLKAYKLRQSIRDYLKDSVEISNVYYYNNSKNTLMAENISKLFDTSITNNSIVVKKYGKVKKVKIDKIESLKEFKKMVNNFNSELLYIGENNTYDIISSSANKINTSFITNNNVYYVNNEEDIDVLYKYSIKSSQSEKLSKNIYLLNIDTDLYDYMYIDNYYSEENTGDLVGIQNDIVKTIDTDISTDVKLVNSKYLYYFKDYNADNYNGTLVVKDINTNKDIKVDNVSVSLPNDDKMFYIFKDYSESSKSYSLSRYRNSKVTDIEYNVISYNFSEEK